MQIVFLYTIVTSKKYKDVYCLLLVNVRKRYVINICVDIYNKLAKEDPREKK